MKLHHRRSFKLKIKEGYEKQIKETATELARDVIGEGVKFKIDTGALFYDFLTQCGVEFPNKKT